MGERTISDEVTGNGDSVLYLFALHEMVTVQGLKQGGPLVTDWSQLWMASREPPWRGCAVLVAESGRVTGEE